MDYEINVATSRSDFEDIFKFRYNVYIERMRKNHLEADHENKMLYDSADNHSILYYSKLNNEIIATLRSQRTISGSFCDSDNDLFGLSKFFNLFNPVSVSINDRLIVEDKFRRSLLCHNIIIRTYTDGLRDGIKLCFISCEESLKAMYMRYGFRSYAKPIALPNGEFRYRLLLILCDKTHLKMVKSPFLQYLPDNLDDKGESVSKIQNCMNINLSHLELTGGI